MKTTTGTTTKELFDQDYSTSNVVTRSSILSSLKSRVERGDEMAEEQVYDIEQTKALVKDNRVSSDTDSFTHINVSTNTGNPIGVTYDSRSKRWIAQLYEYNNRVYIGSYLTAEEASLAYQSRKLNHVKQLAEEWKDKIEPRAYNALLKWSIQ